MRRSLLLSTAGLGIAILPLGAAQAQGPTPFDNPGVYFGVDIGGATNSFDMDYEATTFTGSLDGVVGGFYLGYRFNRPPERIWSFAVEGELNFFGGNNQCPQLHDASIQIDGAVNCVQDNVIGVIAPAELPDGEVQLLDPYGYDIDSVARLRALVGFPGQGIEPFLAVGVAWTRAHVWDLDYSTVGNFTGVTLGAGANIALGPHLYLRPEVLYDIYCPKTYQWGVAEEDVLKVNLQTFTGRIGLTYNF